MILYSGSTPPRRWLEHLSSGVNNTLSKLTILSVYRTKDCHTNSSLHNHLQYLIPILDQLPRRAKRKMRPYRRAVFFHSHFILVIISITIRIISLQLNFPLQIITPVLFCFPYPSLQFLRLRFS